MPRWGGAVQCNYTGEQLFSRYNRGPSPSDARELDKLDDFVTVDANLFVEPAQGWRLNLAVTNLFNRQGQDYFGYLIPASINDALGRRFTLSLTRRL
jgi:outer membrane receptor protein involved in Fe transport